MTQLPLYLTPSQAAKRLNEAGMKISEDAVRRWARRGEIAATKTPGGQYRIRAVDVDAILGVPVAAQ